MIAFYNLERSEDLPKECAVLPGQPAWWEVEPWASQFNPEGFLVARERKSEKLAGYVSSCVVPGERPSGHIDYLDISRARLGSSLRDRLLLQAVQWLRGVGAVEIRSRVHFGYRDEDRLFRRLGFELENPATVWRKST